MKVTVSIDEELAAQVRKIAAERGTSVAGLVRANLEALVAKHAQSERRRRKLDALQRSFKQLQVGIGKISWKREDLHDRH